VGAEVRYPSLSDCLVGGDVLVGRVRLGKRGGDAVGAHVLGGDVVQVLFVEVVPDVVIVGQRGRRERVDVLDLGLGR